MPRAPSVFPHIGEPLAQPPVALPFTRGAMRLGRAIRYSSLSRATLYDLMRAGVIVSRVRCGKRRICRASLEAYLRDGPQEGKG